MRACLHKHFVLSGNKLQDRYLDCSYSLTGDVVWLLNELSQQPDVNKLTNIVSKEKNISPIEAKGYIYELFAQLSEFGGIVIQLDHSFALTERWRFGMQWRHRHLSDAAGFAAAFARAYGVVGGAMLGVGLFLWLQYPTPFLAILIIAPVCMVASFALHELSHILTARAYHVPTALLSKFSYMAIMYRKPSQATARVISLAGPGITVLVCVLGMLLTSGLVSILCAGLAIMHATNILPITADGRAIWKKS